VETASEFGESSLPIQARCPHCASLCQVAEQHLGTPVQCAKCRQSFVVKAPSTNAAICRLEIASATTRGLVRGTNEDSFLVQQMSWSNRDERHEIALVVVPDGMGGHKAGEEASGIVIRQALSALAPLLNSAPTGRFTDATPATLADTIDYAIQEANRAVFRKAKDPACKGMGATAAVLLIWDLNALIGHVGDCRVYHLRGDRLTLLTKDQTLVARMVELGQLTPEEADRHPRRHDVTQALGGHFDIKPARYEQSLAAGDWLIVATDGLHAHLDDSALCELVKRAPSSAAALATQLVETVNARGGSDNCTVVVVRCY
jgi:protein phosphatase